MTWDLWNYFWNLLWSNMIFAGIIFSIPILILLTYSFLMWITDKIDGMINK
jgi:hypothetical protein